MSFDTVPGINRWLGAGVEGGKGGPRSTSHLRRLQRDQAMEVRPRDAGQSCPSYMPLNADPHLLPEHPAVYSQPVCSRLERPASAGGATTSGYQLGAAISQGYGRAPTAYVYTSSDTLLPTTHYQTPLALYGPAAGATATATTAMAPAAAAAINMTSRGRLLQALAFSTSAPASASGSGGVRGTSSAPASPLDHHHHRTLLYTRSATASPEAQYHQHRRELVPAADLLDRLTLLRRFAPATEPAARPPQLVAVTRAPEVQQQLLLRRTAQQHFTPAPPAAPRAQAGGTVNAGGGFRRWAWDDSLLDTRNSGNSWGPGRPIAAVPAPGWRYCGDVVAAPEVEGADISMIVTLNGGCRAGNSPLCVAVAGGTRCAGAAGAAAETGRAEVAVMVRSPRAHRLGLGEGEGSGRETGLEGQHSEAAGVLRGSDGRRPAFRPPGPLLHKFGNKPRPRSAPSTTERAAEQARVAGLRNCGCPRSPHDPVARAEASRRKGASGWQNGGDQRQLRWADEQAATVATAARPLWAEPAPASKEEICGAYQRSSTGMGRSSSSADAEPAIPAGGTIRQPGSALTCNDCSGSSSTSAVEVTTEGANALVVPSPPAHCCGHEQDTVVVVACSSPRRAVASDGGSDVIVAHHHTGSCIKLAPGAALAAAPQRAAAVEQCLGSQQDGRVLPATKLSVSVPAGHVSGLSIRSGSSTSVAAGGAAAGATTAVSSRSSSPIKAWRQQTAPQQRRGPWEPMAMQVGVEVVLSPTTGARGTVLPLQESADLQSLSGEMRRRERSFAQLLEELEHISAKCDKLTATAAIASGGTGSGSTKARPEVSATDRGPPHDGQGRTVPAGCAQQQQQRHDQDQHTTHRFRAGTSRAAAGTPPGAAPAERPSSKRDRAAGTHASSQGEATPAAGVASRRGAGAEWSWESLLAFEETIRAQQRKLVEQGVLPPEYA